MTKIREDSLPFVQTKTGRTRYLLADDDRGETKDRVATVLVHGSGGRANVWLPVMPLFKKIRPIAVDMPGHGESEGALCNSVKESAAFIEDFRKAMGLDRIVVIGHSLGGAFAQHYAYDYPAACHAIVISNSGLSFLGNLERIQKVERDWEGCIDYYALGQVSRKASKEVLAASYEMVRDRDPKILHHDLLQCRGWTSRDWIAQVKTPALIVSAFEDEMTPLDRAMELYSLMPNVQMSIISPCGHSPMLEHPIRFAATVDAFVEELVPRAIESALAPAYRSVVQAAE